MKTKTLILMCILAVLLCTNAQARIIYVDDDANGTNDGSSWQNAYIYLQDALADANSSEKPVEIRIAQGIYKPDKGANKTAGDRESSFVLINNVTLSGGYAGITESDPNERDIEKYETILSGDLAGNDIDITGLNGLQNVPTWGENSYHVILSFGTDMTAVLDGFTITSGHANRYAWRISGKGGGMYNENSQCKIIKCKFFKNAGLYGAGIYNKNSNLFISESFFEGNLAYLLSYGEVGNLGGRGGGMYNYQSNLSLVKSQFLKNSTISFGSGINNYGSNVLLSKCTFINNITTQGSGAAINNNESNMTSNNCYFSVNNAKGYGGALYNYHSYQNITNCTFSGNSAGIKGSCLGSYQESVDILENCILWFNYSPEGTEIALLGSLIGYDLPKIEISYNNISGGSNSVDLSKGGSLEWKEGNIDIDPLFAYPGYWDPNGTPDEPNDDYWVEGDYHLKSQAGRWDPTNKSWVQDDITSPCIDAGDPNSPIGLEPFPNGGYINMGAYGGTSEASKSYFGKPVCTTIVAGDINGDCKVDELDLEIMMLHWLEDNNQ